MNNRFARALVSAALALALLPALPRGLSPAASAEAEDVPEAEKAMVLRELEIMVGDPSGDLRLGEQVDRAQFTTLLVTASALKDGVGQAAATDPYPDVSFTAWYAPYVRAAVDAGLVQGDLEGRFHPEKAMTLGEGATMLVRLLGYTDRDFASYRWPEGQVALYRALGLDAGVSARGTEDCLTRRDCLHLFYNLLTVNTKAGAPYIAQLGHTLNRDGEVDLPALLNVEREGPIPLTGDWQGTLPFPVEDALIYRDEKRAALTDLREWDLLYWAKDRAILFAVSGGDGMGQLSAAVEGPVVLKAGWEARLPFPPREARSVTRNGKAARYEDLREGDVVYWSKYGRDLYCYARRVSGTVESVSPSLASPAAVVIAGQSYPLETLAAQYAFSDLGSYRKGDAVTLLLGRAGGAAAVEPLGEDAFTRFGVVSAIADGFQTDDQGDPYVRPTLTLTATDGLTYLYPWDDSREDVEPGDLVQVVTAGGDAVITPLREQALEGRVDRDAAHLGRLTLSPDVEILDTYGRSGAYSVPKSRIAGVAFSGGMVRCYATDDQGRVTALILNDVTGDLHRYGVLTDVDVVRTGTFLQSTYTCDVGGVRQVYTVPDKQFSVRTGPVGLRMDGQTVETLQNLTAAQNVTLTGQTAASGGRSFTLAQDVAYYLYDADGERCTLATRSQVTQPGYVLTAWYDAPDGEGGRVRVVTARVRE